MTVSTLHDLVQLLPPELPDAPLWMSWNPRTKAPGNGELWSSAVLRSAPDVIATIRRQPHLGIARRFSDGLVALDLDKVVSTPRDLSTLVDWARPIVELALGRGYVEWSQSGRGIHILLRDVSAAPVAWQRKRRLDGRWDWITASNLCHMTMDVISRENSREMLPAMQIIPLLEALMPAAEPPVAPPAPRPVVLPATAVDVTRYQAYGTAGMDRELDTLAQTIEGGRNHALNRAAYALGQLYAGGCIVDVDRYSDEIMNTALAIGLDRGEVRATFRSGFEAGQREPRTPTDRPRRGRLPALSRQSPSVPSVSPSVLSVSPALSPVVTTPRPQVAARQFTSLIHAADLHQLPSTDWLIDRLIGRGVITQLYGKPGSGKSLTALDIALTMAQEHVVVYAPGEAPGELRDRIDAWCAHTQSGVGHLFIYPAPVNLRDHDELGALADECRGRGAAMLVIDPLAESLGIAGLDENTAVDMGVAIAALRTLMHHAGDPALLLVHHAGWDDAHERGSSALRGACRVVVRAQADADDNRITLRVDKANSGKPFEELYYGLVKCESSVVLVPHHAAKPSADAPLSVTQLGVLKALMLQQYSDGATQASICDATGYSRQTVSKAVDRLLKRTLIRRENTILHLEPAGRVHVIDAEAAGGVRTTGMSSADGRYNWRVASPAQPCPLPVASVSPDLSPDLSPATGDNEAFCPLPVAPVVAEVSPDVGSAQSAESALQSEPQFDVSPVSPPCPHDVPEPCPLSPALRGSVKTPQGTTSATDYVLAHADEEPWYRYVAETEPEHGTLVYLYHMSDASNHAAAGRILAHDTCSDSLAWGCDLRGFDTVDDAHDALAQYGYHVVAGVRSWQA